MASSPARVSRMVTGMPKTSKTRDGSHWRVGVALDDGQTYCGRVGLRLTSATPSGLSPATRQGPLGEAFRAGAAQLTARPPGVPGELTVSARARRAHQPNG